MLMWELTLKAANKPLLELASRQWPSGVHDRSVMDWGKTFLSTRIGPDSELNQIVTFRSCIVINMLAGCAEPWRA